MGSEIYANARYLTQPLTGVQRYAHNLVRRMPELGLIAPAAPRAVYDGLPEGRLRVHPSVLKSHLWEQLVLPRAVPKGSVIWSPASIGPLVHRRHVMTVHDVANLEHPEWYSRAYGLWYGRLQPAAVRRAARLICVSEFTKGRVMRLFGVPEKRIRVVYEGLDNVFRRRPEPREIDDEARRRGIERPYLLALGAVSPRKNFDRLARAWAAAAPGHPDVELVIVGQTNLFFSRGGVMTELPARSRHLTDVDDAALVRLIAGARAFLYPSLYEGFGLPVIEAMALGTPVLTSNVTSLPEVAGDAALLVDPYDVDAIRQGIAALLSDDSLCRDLAARGAARVDRFHWDNAARETWAVLKEVAEAR